MISLASTAERKVAMMRLYHYAQHLRGDLSQHLRTVETHPDRVYLVPWDVDHAEGFLRRCDQLRAGSEWVEVDPDDGRRHHGPTAFRSYRGRLPQRFMGDQWILHTHPGLYPEDARTFKTMPGMVAALHRVEFDIDDHSPVDVVGFLGHAKDVLGHKRKGTKTDPRAQLARLIEAGVHV